MTEHKRATFDAPDLLWKMFAGDTFIRCTFSGKALRSNFQDAVFDNCIFDDDFIFDHCNLFDATGLPERFDAPESPSEHSPVATRIDVSQRLIRSR